MAPAKPPEIDTSLGAWIANIQYMLYFPATILTVIGLIVAGTFAEITPRESLKFLDNYIGLGALFLLPFILSKILDWSTGLLAAVVVLIIFARLRVYEPNEGFRSLAADNDEGQRTQIVSNSHRWFIEKILGETPVAISSDRIITTAVQDQNTRTSSTSSANGNTSGVTSSSSGSESSEFDIFSSFQK